MLEGAVGVSEMDLVQYGPLGSGEKTLIIDTIKINNKWIDHALPLLKFFRVDVHQCRKQKPRKFVTI